MTDHSLIALLVVIGSAVQLTIGLLLLGIMAWQGRALTLESQRLTKSMGVLVSGGSHDAAGAIEGAAELVDLASRVQPGLHDRRRVESVHRRIKVWPWYLGALLFFRGCGRGLRHAFRLVVKKIVIRRGFRYRIYPTPETMADSPMGRRASRPVERRPRAAARVPAPARHDALGLRPDQRVDGPSRRRAMDGGRAPTRGRATPGGSRRGMATVLLEVGPASSVEEEGPGRAESHRAAPKGFRLTAEDLTFPKLGEIRAVLHRPIVGTPKRCTIIREVDQSVRLDPVRTGRA